MEILFILNTDVYTLLIQIKNIVCANYIDSTRFPVQMRSADLVIGSSGVVLQITYII